MARPKITIIPGDWPGLERAFNKLFYTTLDESGSLSDYVLADGTRAFTGVVGGITPIADAHLSTKEYVDGKMYYDADYKAAILTED